MRTLNYIMYDYIWKRSRFHFQFLTNMCKPSSCENLMALVSRTNRTTSSALIFKKAWKIPVITRCEEICSKQKVDIFSCWPFFLVIFGEISPAGDEARKRGSPSCLWNPVQTSPHDRVINEPTKGHKFLLKVFHLTIWPLRLKVDRESGSPARWRDVDSDVLFYRLFLQRKHAWEMRPEGTV